MTVAGIPTVYRGTNFRSRLEARWAAFFDLVGWPWVYEPFDAHGWIPDFLIRGKRSFLVEVGPCVTEQDYRLKADKPSRFLELPTLVVGASVQTGEFGDAGLFVNEFRRHPIIGSASWFNCAECGRMAIYCDGDCHYPCGHHDTLPLPNLEHLWRNAGNDVQWKP